MYTFAILFSYLWVCIFLGFPPSKYINTFPSWQKLHILLCVIVCNGVIITPPCDFVRFKQTEFVVLLYCSVFYNKFLNTLFTVALFIRGANSTHNHTSGSIFPWRAVKRGHRDSCAVARSVARACARGRHGGDNGRPLDDVIGNERPLLLVYTA